MKPIKAKLHRPILVWCCAIIAGLPLAASAATLTNRYSFTTDVTDSVSGMNGTLSNATVSAGQAILASPFATLSSDTVNGQWVDLPDDLLTNYNAITVETWITPTHDDFTGGAFWNRVWDFGNSDGNNGTSSFWGRGGNSTTPVAVDLFYPGSVGGIVSGPSGVIPNGTESHVAWTSDGSTLKGRLYVNGVLVAVNENFAANPMALGSTTNNWLGRSQFALDTFWSGSINEFRVYQGVLNPLEMAASYAAGPDTVAADPGTVTNVTVQVPTPIAVGGDAQAKVLVQASGLTNAVDIARSSLAVVYVSGNTNIATVNSNGFVVAVASGTTTIAATYSSLSSTQSVTVIAVPTTMKNRYSFTADATDSVGGQNGTLWGNAQIIGGQVAMDGVPGSYVDLPPYLISTTNMANKAVTIEGWATFNAGQGDWTRLFDFGNISGTVGGNYLFLTPSGGGGARAVASDTVPGYNGESFAQTTSLIGQTNVYVAMVYNPNANRQIIAIYVNGTLRAQAANVRAFANLNNAYSFLGRALYSGDPWLAGSIDEFRIYDGELSRFQIAASFQSGTATPNFNPGTYQSIVVGAGSTLPVDQVRQASVIINFSAATNINLLGDVQLTLTSSDTNVATITSPAGVVTARGLGTTTITATYNYIVGVTTNTYTANTALSTYIAPATMVHRYTFNEGAGELINDIVGGANGHLASGTNVLGITNAVWLTGKLSINTNTTLAAADAYVNLPAGIISTLGSDATFEIWATEASAAGWQRLFDFGSVPASPTNGAQPNIFLTRGPGNTTPRYDWVSGNINANAVWANDVQAHFVVTHSGTAGAARLYRDGVLVASSANQNLPLSSINDIYNFLGRSIYSWPISLPGGFFDPYMQGSFDEFRIYTGLLTQAEIVQQYAIGPNQIIANVPLSYTVSGGNLVFSWPTYGAHFALETTSSLSPASWGPAGGAVTQSGATYQQSVAIGAGNAYFRLKR